MTCSDALDRAISTYARRCEHLRDQIAQPQYANRRARPEQVERMTTYRRRYAEERLALDTEVLDGMVALRAAL